MARELPKIGWTARSGEYFEGTIEEKRAQETARTKALQLPQTAVGMRKYTEKIRQQQEEEKQLEGLLTRRATGAGVGYPGQPGYIAPTHVTIQQKYANLAELQKWRRLKAGYGGVGGYVAPGQYVPSAAGLSFMGGTGLTTSLKMGGGPEIPTSSILRKFITPTPTPQPSPQQIMPTAQPTYEPPPRPTPTLTTTPMTFAPQPTPITPTPQPTPMPSISFSPTTPQAQPTYQPAPAQTYQSSYYQANGYKPYSYKEDTFGDKPFSYAYQRPRLQQSYTGI